MRKKLKIAVGLALTSLLAVGVATALGRTSFEVTSGNLRVSGSGDVKPNKLPKKKFAPITLNVRGQVETLDGSVPPVLNKVTVDFDKNGKPFSKGIRSCRQRQLEARTTEEVRSREVCGRSRVGSGTSDILVTFPDQTPITGTGQLTAFKTRGGNLLFHTRLVDPIVTTVVAKGKVTKAPGRRFRTRVITRIPKIADGDGRLVAFDLTIGGNRADTWRFKGKKRKFATARCGNKRLVAKATADFADGSTLKGQAAEPCKVKRNNRNRRR